MALALLVLAASSPRRTGIVDASPGERTLVVALDVSMSMLATDVAPTRLAEARRQVREAMEAGVAGRVALVAFAAEPTLVCPPTTDGRALVDLTEATEERAALPGPSRASLALLRGLALLSRSGGDIVLVSDGEFPDEDRERIADAVRSARGRGVRVSTIAVGTRDGAALPVRDGSAGQTAADAEGRPLVTRVDAALLQWIAVEGGGEFTTLVPGARVDLAASTERLRLAGDRTPVHLRAFGPASMFGYPLLIAIALLGADAWLAWRPRRAVSAAALAVLVLTATPAPAFAQADVAAIRRGNAALASGRVPEAISEYRRALALDEASAIARANLGTALYRAGDHAAAADALASAMEGLRDPAHIAASQYNLGNALARLGRLDDALAAYRASLRIRDDDAARFNYALVWRWKQAQDTSGLSAEPPMQPERVQELREKARALDVPIVRRPSDARRVEGDR